MMRLPHKLLLTLLLCALQAAACTAFADLDAVEKQEPAGGDNNTPSNNNTNNDTNNDTNNNSNSGTNNTNNATNCSSNCADKGAERCAEDGRGVESCEEIERDCLMWQLDADESCLDHQRCVVGEDSDEVECVCADPEPCPTSDLTCAEADPGRRIVCEMVGEGEDACAVYSEAPCGAGDLCDTGQCVTACTNDEGCGGGRCLNERCYATCDDDNDCNSATCFDGVCLATCEEASTCLSTEDCPADMLVPLCEPACVATIAGQQAEDSPGFSRQAPHPIDMNAAPVVAHLCRGKEAWIQLPPLLAGDEVTLSLAGSNLDELEFNFWTPGALDGARAPLDASSRVVWRAPADGAPLLQVRLPPEISNAIWADVDITLTRINPVTCAQNPPRFVYNAPVSVTSNPLMLSRMLCPNQELWIGVKDLKDRATVQLMLAAAPGVTALLMEEDSAPLWDGSLDTTQRLELRNARPGELLLRLANFGTSSAMVSGQLSLLQADACGDDQTGNNSPKDAAWLAQGEQRGVLCFERPQDPRVQDFYKLAPPESGWPSGASVRVNNTATLAWSSTPEDESSWSTSGPMVDLSAVAATNFEPVYVRVRPVAQPSQNNPARYTLTTEIALMADPGLLGMDDPSQQTRAQPGLLNQSVMASGLLSSGKQVDYWTFTLASPVVSTPFLEITHDTNALGALLVEVFNEGGRQVARRYVRSPEASLLLERLPAAGTYRVQVSAVVSPETSSFAIPYTLSWKLSPSCADGEGLEHGGMAMEWAELGVEGGSSLCPAEQASVRYTLQEDNAKQIGVILRRAQELELPLRWVLEGPPSAGEPSPSTLLWSGPLSSLDELLLAANQEPRLLSGDYTLSLFNPNPQEARLALWALERDQTNSLPPTTCPEQTMEGLLASDHSLNSLLFSPEPAPAGQLLVDGTPVSATIGFCGDYGDPSDRYFFHVAGSEGTDVPVHISFAAISGPALNTPPMWTVHSSEGDYEASGPGEGEGFRSSTTLLLSPGWYRLTVQPPPVTCLENQVNVVCNRIEGVDIEEEYLCTDDRSYVQPGSDSLLSCALVPGNQTSTRVDGGYWYSVSVSAQASGAALSCELEGDDVLPRLWSESSMRIENPVSAARSITLTNTDSTVMIDSAACPLDVDMLRVTAPLNHDIRATLISVGEPRGSLALMEYDLDPDDSSMFRWIRSNFTQVGEGLQAIPAVAGWSTPTIGQNPGRFLFVAPEAIEGSVYTLLLEALDCRDVEVDDPNRNTEPSSPSSTTNNNSRATGRIVPFFEAEGDEISIPAVLCSWDRDVEDWFKYTNSESGNSNNNHLIIASLCFERMDNVRDLTLEVYQGSSQMSVPGLSFEDNETEYCGTISFTCTAGQTCSLRVTRSDSSSGVRAAQAYTLTVKRLPIQ